MLFIAHTSWKGSISIGLFNLPCKLELAAKHEKVETDTICPDCEEPVKMNWQGYKCPNCGKEINHWSKGDRGFEFEDEDGNTQYIRIAKEEREAMKLGRSDRIEIIGFAPSDTINFPRMVTGKPYYVVPQDEGTKQYAILAERLGDRVALGKVVFGSKEHLIGIFSKDKMLVATRLYYNEEIRVPSEFEVPEVTKQEREAAEEMVSKQTITPEWDEYHDEYKTSLEEVIEQRISGEEVEIETPEIEEPEEDQSVVEAMKATAEA